MSEAVELGSRWAALMRRLGATGDLSAAFAAVTTAWAEPHRVYHTTAHLMDCLERLDEAPPTPGRDAVEAALWFHDVVYDPRAADNEARSAAQAHETLVGLGAAAGVPEGVARLVLLTRHTEPPPDEPAGELVCDVDLSILGRDPEVYDEFERRIRAEYRWVPDPLFRAERARILAALLGRDRLFRTAWFRERYERPARANLARTLDRLAGA